MIRQANKKDIPKIQKLISWGAKNSKILPRSRKEITKVLPYFYVCEVNKEVIGCAALEIYIHHLIICNNLDE